MLSYFILAAALLIPAPSSAGRLASATRRAQTSSVVILGAVSYTHLTLPTIYSV